MKDDVIIYLEHFRKSVRMEVNLENNDSDERQRVFNSASKHVVALQNEGVIRDREENIEPDFVTHEIVRDFKNGGAGYRILRCYYAG